MQLRISTGSFLYKNICIFQLLSLSCRVENVVFDISTSRMKDFVFENSPEYHFGWILTDSGHQRLVIVLLLACCVAACMLHRDQLAAVLLCPRLPAVLPPVCCVATCLPSRLQPAKSPPTCNVAA
jgi:hypothetical protein